jgi:hypothetical protein
MTSGSHDLLDKYLAQCGPSVRRLLQLGAWGLRRAGGASARGLRPAAAVLVRACCGVSRGMLKERTEAVRSADGIAISIPFAVRFSARNRCSGARYNVRNRCGRRAACQIERS